jgi:hypothetical protein|tara:strand:- start:1 stop:633 length:633 start_codon:yes stop_codon:yes gene_type:complete
MSDYTLAVSWSGKDALADSDAAKVVSGADFNTEFTTIRTAINSKADISSETLTGIPLAPTASAGTNTTQIATTAYVTTAIAAEVEVTAAIINALVYPVGSIYFNMAVATNPATLLGMGTWVAYGEGRVLVGKQSSGTFDALDESLGAETHTLTTAEMPSHTHGGVGSASGTNVGNAGGGALSGTTSATGGGGAHSNLQPSVTVYMWKRTA